MLVNGMGPPPPRVQGPLRAGPSTLFDSCPVPTGKWPLVPGPRQTCSGIVVAMTDEVVPGRDPARITLRETARVDEAEEPVRRRVVRRLAAACGEHAASSPDLHAQPVQSRPERPSRGLTAPGLAAGGPPARAVEAEPPGSVFFSFRVPCSDPPPQD